MVEGRQTGTLGARGARGAPRVVRARVPGDAHARHLPTHVSGCRCRVKGAGVGSSQYLGFRCRVKQYSGFRCRVKRYPRPCIRGRTHTPPANTHLIIDMIWWTGLVP